MTNTGPAARLAVSPLVGKTSRMEKHETSEPGQTPAHHQPHGLSDQIAYRTVKILRLLADAFFAGRYGHRAIVLETVAAVPGMVGGMLQHLKALRYIRDDQGWIRELIDEAENERMHLMTFFELVTPTRFERVIVMITQALFFVFYFLLYLLAPRTAHRLVGYLEEEAVVSYTQYLHEIDAGRSENLPAPQIAINYWKLPDDARLREVIEVIRADESGHRDRNHEFATSIDRGEH